MTFTSSRSTAVPYYMEIIKKDGKPFASIVEINQYGRTYYHGVTTNGQTSQKSTIVELKQALFSDLNEFHDNATKAT